MNLSLQGTCSLKGQKGSFNGDFDNTSLSGDESIARQEQLFYSVRADAESLSIKGSRLTIETKRGEELDLEKL